MTECRTMTKCRTTTEAAVIETALSEAAATGAAS
jgi:hypothetical protein